jgi:DNA replication protein DnaC
MVNLEDTPRRLKSAANIMAGTMTRQTCSRCNAPFDYFVFKHSIFEAEQKNGFACDACAQKQARDEEREILRQHSPEARRAADWRKRCPLIFQETDRAQLPREQLAKVEAWQYGPKGLLLYGDSGQGKSRCAWLIAEREFIAGRSIEVIDCEFALEYAAKFSMSPKAADEFLKTKIKADLLLLDDTFKAKLTDSNEQALFVILNKRSESKRPCIVTVNGTSEALAGRMTEDRAAAYIRRLKEFCTPVYFTLKQTQIPIAA